MKRLILMTALLAVFGGCSKAPSASMREGATSQASTGFPWSGLRANGVTDGNGNPVCLSLANNKFGTKTCNVGVDQTENFALMPSAVDLSNGIPAKAFTTDQQLFQKSSGLCLGYGRTGNVGTVTCAANANGNNDLQYTDGAIYANGINSCLNTAANAWESCFSTDVSWSPINMTCFFDVSAGAGQTQYLQLATQPGPVAAAGSTVGSPVIGGLVQPNSGQDWCVEFSGPDELPSVVTLGACSTTASTEFMTLLLGNPGGTPVGITTTPSFLNVANRTTFAGITDSVVSGTPFPITAGGESFFINPTAIGSSEQWVPSGAPNSLRDAVHLHCVSTL